MRFPDSFLDDIRDRLRISEVIGQRVDFDKKKTNAAKGDYWACCPFHGEKTPSFHCEDRKGRYYCFGCGVSGDHFRFLTELDGLSFAEAVERLAVQAGLPMPVMDRREQEREEKRKTLFDVMELAAKFFQQQLHEPVGAAARAYLRDRGLSSSIQQEFGIGYSPNSRNGLKEYLSSKGIDTKQMEACGLVVSGEDIPVPYDRFRDRIMFPIQDSRGRTIAFGGRAMNPDAPAKYLNSPETEIFKKSNVLYNFLRARRSSQSHKTLIVVEGYMDVIALHAAGFENVVAPLGTALTESHLDTIWRTVDEPTLCFDGDQAGVRAANRTMDLSLSKIVTGKSLKFCLLPDGLDPDDFVSKFGANEFRSQLDNSMPLSEYLVARRTNGVMLETPEQKAAIEKQIFADLAVIRDPLLAKYFGTHIRFRLVEGFGLHKRKKEGWPKSKTAQTSKNPFDNKNRSKRRHSVIIGLCIEYPYLFEDYIEEIADVNFEQSQEMEFVSELYRLFVEDKEITAAEIYKKISPSFYEILEKFHGDEIIELTSFLEKNGSIPWSTKRGHRLLSLFPMLKFDPPPFLVKETLELHLLEEKKENMDAHFEKFNYDKNPEMGLKIYEERFQLNDAFQLKVRKVDNYYQLLADRPHLVDDDFNFDHSSMYDMSKQTEAA
ncbi:MAG: DNA primase [Pseudomonadota bacterium]